MATTLRFRYLPLLILFCALFGQGALAQTGVAVNTTGAAPDPSAILDITSSARGLLIPRMTSVQRTAILAPATGLLVYQTDDPAPYSPNTSHGLWYFNGAVWTRLSSNVQWSITGNTGTNAATDYIGTIAGTNEPLVIRTNNQVRMTIDGTNGRVGVNTATMLEALNVNGAIRLSKPAPLYPVTNYSRTNQIGTIRFDPTVPAHMGNVNNAANGWRQMENAERLLPNEDYTGFNLTCPGSPGLATGGVQTGQTNAATPARWRETPFPTSTTAQTCGNRVQYLFRASELSNPPFNMCAGNITSITFFAIDDDVLAPAPGAAMNITVKIENTAFADFSGGLWDATLNGAVVRYVNNSYNASAGLNTFTLTTPFNWNGTSNIIVEVAWRKAGVLGVSPRVLLTSVVGFPATKWGYDVNNTIAHGNTYTDAPVFPATLQTGVGGSRPVIQFGASVKNATPVNMFDDVVAYTGGMMIAETPAWAAANYRGPGTIRAENRVFDGNTQLSDHVFDRYFEGTVRPGEEVAAARMPMVPLNELEDHLERERHLPTMPSRTEWESQGPSSIGSLVTGLWGTVEQQALYIAELERDLKVLEDLAYAKGMKDGEWKRLMDDVERSPRLSPEQKQALLTRLRERAQH